MYQTLLVGATEKDLYNRFVAHAPKGHILQAYEWGDIKGKGEWVPFRLLIKDHQGHPCAAISLLKRTIPGLRKAFFYAPRGPVGDIHNEELMDFLFTAVKKLAHDQRAVFLKIDPDIACEEEEFQAYLRKRGFIKVQKGAGFEGIQPRFVFRLDLRPPAETLFENLHAKTRYNIRLAEKKGVMVRDDLGKEALPLFYQILKETTERDKFLVRSYQYFSDLWDHLAPAGYLKLFMAYYQDHPVAGTLAFLYGDKAWYIYGASSNAHRNVMPNYLLQWRMIQWAKANHCVLYDFRGVPGHVSEEHPLYGLVRFKKGFNGRYTEFIGEYDQVYAPFYYWLWNTLEPVYQKNIRRWINFKRKLRRKKGGQS